MDIVFYLGNRRERVSIFDKFEPIDLMVKSTVL